MMDFQNSDMLVVTTIGTLMRVVFKSPLSVIVYSIPVPVMGWLYFYNPTDALCGVLACPAAKVKAMCGLLLTTGIPVELSVALGTTEIWFGWWNITNAMLC